MEEVQAGLRGVIRVAAFLVFLIIFLVAGYYIHFTTRGEAKRRRRFAMNATRVNRMIVRLFGIRVNVINRPSNNEIYLLVSNHMGFIDILAVSSIMPNLFITSQEMRETPVLGLITEMAGCIYVDRRNRMKTVDEMKVVARALSEGLRVVLYPEATSTDGEKVLPFKRTLMMAAGYAGVPIQPVVVNFREINGESFTRRWRDHVCWYGDITFAMAAWRAMTLKSLTIEVEFLERMYPKIEDDRGAIADHAHDMIAAKFTPVQPI